uniref:E3 ubiquitin/ISG15 ligase TRIM25-like n=1 Tax=Neogobius melanostomus TaxID=47308 RepID=A0A8C6UKD6_9GOBI
MAEGRFKLNQETFRCCICLDLLKKPVTIPCGHSYCMNCVNTHWDGEVEKQSYSCPQCRQNFAWRPILVKNTMLAAVVEELNDSKAAADLCSAAHGDVSCDLCCEKKVKAVKSCLQCLVSYCKEHLQPHYDVAANLQENICPRHDEVMKMFCRTDQQCICYLCSVDQHKGHHTVLAVEKRNEMQGELEDSMNKVRQRIQDRQKHLDSLQKQTDEVIRSGNTQQLRSQQESEERRGSHKSSSYLLC